MYVTVETAGGDASIKVSVCVAMGLRAVRILDGANRSSWWVEAEGKAVGEWRREVGESSRVGHC